jgi:diaminopimelate decarboxylase
VFSGVGKSEAEMRQALEAGILCFNVESAPELERLNAVAGGMGKVAPISLRVNPDVDAKTHPYISTGLKQNKFGVAYTEAFDLYRKAAGMPHLRITGMDCHIGSQLTEASPFIAAAEKVLALADRLAAAGIVLEHLDLGGGLGIRYDDETPPSIAEYAQALLGALQGRSEKIIVEPGRVLVGNAGVLLTRIEYLKHGEEKNFAIVDAAMNDLMRPALYDAYHAILPVQKSAASSQLYEVVGPVCETGDFLGHARQLGVSEGDVLAVMSAGAYGMSMSSNYNTRPRAAEVMVDGAVAHLIRERETVRQLYAAEKIVA